MATNPPKGDGHRNGAVRNCSQVQNPVDTRDRHALERVRHELQPIDGSERGHQGCVGLEYFS